MYVIKWYAHTWRKQPEIIIQKPAKDSNVMATQKMSQANTKSISQNKKKSKRENKIYASFSLILGGLNESTYPLTAYRHESSTIGILAEQICLHDKICEPTIWISFAE